MHDKECKAELQKITLAEEIEFTDRSNIAILASFRMFKKQGYDTVLMQDQGGWLTYPQFAKKLKLKIIYLPTDDGKIDPVAFTDFLKNKTIVPSKTFVIINSLAGYAVQNDMNAIYSACKTKNIPLINDVSGSIGTKNATMNVSDIIVGSFGSGKPIDLGAGGFIARSAEWNVDIPIQKKELHFDILLDKLKLLPKRRKKLEERSKQIKTDLKQYDIVMKKDTGINVIVKFPDEQTKNAIELYCQKNNLEFTLCPRYIRVTSDAVSIEVKRLH